jgi:iron complex outermembrane receptor protein
LLDGVPVNDGYAGSQKTMGFSVDDIDRVEVILGPAASLYGNNAMGGVVSYYTRMPDAREFRYRIGYGGDASTGNRGASNLQNKFFSYGDKFDSGLKLLISASQVSTDGYVTDLVTRTTAPAGVTGYQQSFSPTGGKVYVVGDKGRLGATNGQYLLRAEYDLGGMDKIYASVNEGYQQEFNNQLGTPNSYMTSTTTGATTYTPTGSTLSSYLLAPTQTQRTFLTVGLDKRVSDSMLKLKASRTVQDYWYVTSFGSTATVAGGPAQRVWNQMQTNYFEGQVETPLNDKHVLTWGLTDQADYSEAYNFNITDWRNVDSTTGSQNYIYTGSTDTVGLFAQDEWALSNATTAFLGVRGDSWKGHNGSAYQASPAVNTQYATTTADALSPRVGIVHKLNTDIALRASAGTAFRAPNMFDLYRPFPSSIAGGTYSGSNPNLKPEKMSSVDFGTDANLWGGASIKAGVYFNYFTDMQYTMPIGTATATPTAAISLACPDILPGQICTQKTNIGAANSRGLELTLKQAFSPSVSSWVYGTWMHSEITQDAANPAAVGKQFTQVPHQTAGLGIDYDTGNWMTSLSANYKGKQYSSSDDANAQTVWGVWSSYDAYTTVDAKAMYRINKEMKLSISVNNLLDRMAFSYYQIQGRTYLMELSGSL